MVGLGSLWSKADDIMEATFLGDIAWLWSALLRLRSQDPRWP